MGRLIQRALSRAITVKRIPIKSKAIASCPEENNHVCGFSDCPCKNKGLMKAEYRSVGQELMCNRFLNEVR
jgi:hypothetical protein